MLLNSEAVKNSTPELPVETASVMARVVRFAPYVLAAFFLLWSLRGVTGNEVHVPDAARHLMNGVFVHDMVRDGQLAHPVGYGKFYYSRLPALSMPYHPPVFPLIESLFFFVFGVNLFAARLAVALMVALSVFLLYRLIISTHGSHLLATVSILTFFSLSISQYVATDVMLEFPAMVFMLAALYHLRDLARGYTLLRGLSFALLAAAAVWTKQQTVFLGLVPFFYVIIARRWRLLAGKTIWISSALFGACVLLLLYISMKFNGAGLDQVSKGASIFSIFMRNVGIYAGYFQEWFGLVPAILLGLAFFAALFMRRSKEENPNDLYLAWVAAALIFHLLLDAYEERYLIFLIPALLVVGYSMLIKLCRRIWPPARVWYVPALVALAWLIINLSSTPVEFLHGPSEVAQVVAKAKPDRVLYCGRTNGNFIFTVRTLDPQLHTVIIRGDKLPEAIFTPEEFEDFAHRYGINYIVLEHTLKSPKDWTMPWDGLRLQPTPSMAFEREIQLSSSDAEYNGELRIYRFTNPSVTPESTLKLPIPKIKGDFEMNF